jgi:hypothetical protein
MRTHLSLVQAIGFCLVYIALGFLYPIVSISLNPFEAAPFWIVTLALSILLIGLVLGLEGYLLSPLQNAQARSFPNRLGQRPRLWDTSRVKSFPKKFLKGDS